MDAMAGSMNEVVTEPCRADNITADVVDLPTMDSLTGGEGLLDEIDCGVAGIANYFEDPVDASWNLCAGKRGPGYIGIDGTGPVYAGPEVYKDKVPCRYGRMPVAGRLVMRGRAVGVNRHYRRIARYKAALGESVQYELLNIVFGDGLPGAKGDANLGKCSADDVIKGSGRGFVKRQLVRRPCGFEIVDEVRRRDDVDSE